MRMDIAVHIFVILLSCAALGKGADWLVDSAARIAKRLGISELVIGLTLVAFGTSAPEFAVTINAAIRNLAAVSVGNVVGSNIFNIGFILGAVAIVTSVKASPSLVWRDGGLLALVTVLLLWILWDSHLSRFEGGVLLALMVGYLLLLLMLKRDAAAGEQGHVDKARWRDFCLLIVGLALVIAGGYFLVESSVVLARRFGMSEWLIGITIVAAGTSMPELVISLVALLKKHHGISAGNLIGSNIFNTLGVLGLAGLLRPMQIEGSVVVTMAMLLFLTVLVMLFMRTGWRVRRWEGCILLVVGLLIWLYNAICGGG